MIDHLKHMAATRPPGPDRDAAIWALAEIARLQDGWDEAFRCGISHQTKAVRLMEENDRLRAETAAREASDLSLKSQVASTLKLLRDLFAAYGPSKPMPRDLMARVLNALELGR